MEDDDEFGDLYTDVLQPFQSSSSPPAPTDSFCEGNPNQERSAEQETRGDGELARAPSPDINPKKKSYVDFTHQDVKFDIEEDDGGGGGIGGVGSETVIPGIFGDAEEASRTINEIGEGEDWDSGSDDDLQIVLNDSNKPLTMERGGMGMVADEDDDDDGANDDGLNIVAGGDLNQGAEQQEGGENATQPVEGEMKYAVEDRKAGGSSGVTVAPKIGYGHQGFHPFHSQFKYVRPGAAPIPGATTAPGGLPGQIRPPAHMNHMAGRGRGDWRPAGMKGATSMQKGFHAGPGLPIWGNNAAGRGFGGGLEFTLPSHK